MQRLARWTNLSETTFVLPPTTEGADYRVRIFTPVTELPFAGHPTLGTCHAWLQHGGDAAQRDAVVQECAAGLIPIRRAERLAFAAPPLIRSGPADDSLVDELAAALQISRDDIVAAEWVDNGPGWVAVQLPNAEAVLAVRPAFADLDIGLVGGYPPGSPEAIEVRAFFPKDGVLVEDPVTGSLNASARRMAHADRPHHRALCRLARNRARAGRARLRQRGRRRAGLGRRRNRDLHRGCHRALTSECTLIRQRGLPVSRPRSPPAPTPQHPRRQPCQRRRDRARCRRRRTR